MQQNHTHTHTHTHAHTRQNRLGKSTQPHSASFISILRVCVFGSLQLALYVLSFLEPRALLQAAQTCRYWRILAEDNLLWREKCREDGKNTQIHLHRQCTNNRGGEEKVLRERERNIIHI